MHNYSIDANFQKRALNMYNLHVNQGYSISSIATLYAMGSDMIILAINTVRETK